MKGSFLKEFGSAFLFFVLLTLPFYVWNIDIGLQQLFWNGGEWMFRDLPVWRFLYDYGPALAFAASAGCLVLWLLSFAVSSLRSRRREFAFVFLLMIVGPGLFVNAVFKEYWGRPRPREIVQFDGGRAYVPPLVMGEFVSSRKYEKMLESSRGGVEWDILRNLYALKGRYNSFPNGHASVGFFMMFPYFLYRRSNRTAAMTWLGAGTFYGILMGVGRMAQGGHFASDTLWAGAMIYLSGLVLCYLLRICSREEEDT